MLIRQVLPAVLTATILGVGGVAYAWGSWVTETLIAVDKRTEVMAAHLDFIREEMERTYGNITKSNATTDFKSASKE